MLKTPATYRTAVAYGKMHSWSCGRCLNNRGTMTVIQLGNQLWRSDTRQKTTVHDLEADGWHRVKPQKWGR